MKAQYKILSIQQRLQQAIELELTTIPPYLTAWFSIKSKTNIIAAEAVRSVVMEEMLHMALAGNILIAINGQVKLRKENIPVYPCRMKFNGKDFKNREFDLNLSKLSKETLHTFMRVELPEFLDEKKPKKAMQIPAYTIGEFYHDIIADLEEVCREIGQENVFCGSVENQVSQEFYWHGGGGIFKVSDLATAKKAINLIVEQGEGTSGNPIDISDLPHYFKFKELYCSRRYKTTDNLEIDPTGDVIVIDYSSIYNIKDNCKHIDYSNQPELEVLNKAFNSNYSMMLSQIEEGFSGNPRAFYTAIMNGMHQLTEIAVSIMQLPLKNDTQGRYASPTFEWQD